MRLFPIVLKNTKRQEVVIIYQTKMEFYKLDEVLQISDPVAELEMALGHKFRKIEQGDFPLV